MKRPNLIALSGAAGAGKDAVARLLVEQHGWQGYSLAAPLKRFAADVFGFTHEQLYGPSSARNASDPRWNLTCPTCRGAHGVEHCSRCRGKGRLEISPRTVLQPFGCEYLRDLVHPDVLTLRAAPDIKDLLERGVSVVVNDARFQNDRDNLHAWFGARRVNVRSVRTQKRKYEAWRLHRSENDLPADDAVEYVIQNDEPWPFPSLKEKVEAMLQVLFH